MKDFSVKLFRSWKQRSLKFAFDTSLKCNCKHTIRKRFYFAFRYRNETVFLEKKKERKKKTGEENWEIAWNRNVFDD